MSTLLGTASVLDTFFAGVADAIDHLETGCADLTRRALARLATVEAEVTALAVIAPLVVAIVALLRS